MAASGRLRGSSGAEAGSSPNRLCVAIGVPLARVSYHVHQLKKAGLIELVATEQRR